MVEMVIEQLVYMVSFGKAFSQMTSEDLIRYGCWDPVRLFIKNEPHSAAKLAEGRLRLIANVSLRTQLVERVICGPQNNAEIRSWWKSPAKPGLGLDDDSLMLLSDSILKITRKGLAAMTDVSGWDWAVKLWLLWADAERRRIAARVSEDSLFAEMCYFRAYCTANSVYGLPDGELVAQCDAGIQNSGSYCTSSTNSWMRIILFLVACLILNPDLTDQELQDMLELCMAMGDDCVELFVEGVLNVYLDLGFKASLAETSDKLEGVEFCSHIFNADGTAIPTSWPRTLYRFFSHKIGSDTPDRMAQLDYVLRHHPNRFLYMGIAKAWVEQANKIHVNGTEIPTDEQVSESTRPATCSDSA